MGDFQAHNSKGSERTKDFFLHRGIRNKKVFQVKNFQVLLPNDETKRTAPPPPLGLKG